MTTKLPEEIIIDILLRLPVKSLVRFKCVCKPWCLLISQPYFIRQHVNHAHHIYYENVEDQFETAILYAMDGRLTFKYMEIYKNIEPDDNHVGQGSNDCTPIVLSCERLDFPVDIVDAYFKGYCDGILCLATERDCVVLWNPSIKEYKRLHLRSPEFCAVDAFGIGYDPSVDDYKVLRVPSTMSAKYIRSWSPEGAEFFYSSVEVYSLKSDTWKMIQDNFPYRINLEQFATFTNECLHWVAEPAIIGEIPFTDVAAYAMIEELILYFDVVEEKLGEMLLPRRCGDWSSPSELQLFRGNLCLLRYHYESHFEFWVMKEYRVEESWVKLLTVPQFIGPSGMETSIEPFCWTRNGIVVILDQTTREFGMYDAKDGTLRRRFFIKSLPKCPHKVVYVESLVSPFGGCRIN